MSNENDQNNNAIGVLIAAHGDLAQALAETATHLSGELVKRSIAWTSVNLGESSNQDALKKMALDIESADGGAGVLVLADLFGGSAANLALAQLGDSVEVVTGANLAMVVDALCSNETELHALAERVAGSATESVIVANGLLKSAA